MNIIEKLAQLYTMDSIKCTYRIEYVLTVIVLAIMNAVGLVVILAPLVLMTVISINSPIHQILTLNIEQISIVSLVLGVYYAFSSICFIHNKNQFFTKTIWLTSFLFLGIALAGMLALSVSDLMYSNYRLITGNSKNPSIVLFMDTLILFTVSGIYLSLSKKDHVKNFLDKHLTKHTQN